MIFRLADWRPEPLTGRQLARLHSLLSVGLQRLADALLQPMSLLAATVWLLNGSVVDIAIIAVVASASMALGSIIMPYVLSLVEDVRLVILGASMVRAAAAACIAALGWQAPSLEKGDFVSLLVVSMLMYQIGSAVNITTNPRSTSVNLEQPTSLRARQSAGALAGVVGGLVAWRTLANDALSFPGSAGWLLALGGSASVAAIWFQITQPVRRDAFRYRPSLVRLGEVQAVLKIANMRRFLTFRLLLGFTEIADPFLIVYGVMHMGLQLAYVGAIMFILALSQVVGGVVWTVFRQARGSRRSLQVAAMLRLAGISLAVGVPQIANSSAYADRFDTQAVGAWAFVAAFALLGVGQSTYLRNEQAYAMRITAGQTLYPASITLINASLVMTSTAALVGAWIIHVYSLETAIVISAIISFLALLASGLLVGPRTHRRRSLKPSLRGSRKPVRVRKRKRLRRSSK